MMLVSSFSAYEVNSRPIGAQLGVFVHGAFDKDDTNTSDNFFSIRLEVWNSEFKVPHGDQNLSTSDSIEHIGIDQIEYRVPIVGNIDQIDFVQDITKSLVIDVKESMLHHIDDGQMEFRLRLRTNLPINFAVRLAYDTTPIDKSVGVIYAAVILLCLYVLIIWEIVHRTFAAMIASATSIAVLALMNERPTMPEVVSWIDVETMLLLFGMMVLVAILSETGVFDYSAVYAYKVSQQKSSNYFVLTNSVTLPISDHQRPNLATDKLSVFIHSPVVVLSRQCNDSITDDTCYDSSMRSDAAESGADFDVDDFIHEYRWDADTSR